MLPRVNLIHTDIGEFLLYSTNDYISKHLYIDGTWDSHLLKLTRLIYANIDSPVILDIGANLGAYSVPVGRDIISKGGQIHSFEPQRIIYHQLCGNLLLNRLDNVFTYNVAVGAEDGIVEIPVLNYNDSENIGAFSLDEQLQKISKIF